MSTLAAGPATPRTSPRGQTLSLLLARKITPSPEKAADVEHRVIELSSPKKAAGIEHRVIELSSPKKRVASTSHTESPTPKRHLKSISFLVDTSVRHVVFDFTLVDGCRARFPSPEELEILDSLYPTQYGIAVCGVFLVVHVRELPPQPWPLTVAGLPFYITTDEFDMPWPFGTTKKHSGNRVLQELDAQEYVNDKLFTAAIKWFDEESTVTISSILWSTGMWQVTIPDGSDTSDLPFRLCRAACTYLYQSEMPEQPEAAFRQKTPTTTIRDDTTYNILRPGVMISSGRFLGDASALPRSELYTTAGVLVKDKDGNEFMTVASHGFPLGEDTVFHPGPNGTVIGAVERRLSETDIALVRLQDRVVFEDKCFQSPKQLVGVEFTQVIASEHELRVGDVLSMDNPFTGHIESVYYATGRRRIPADGNSPEFYWCTQEWSWFGQHADAIPAEGSCGSPIWDEDGKLVGFFRYLTHSGPRAGFGFGVSAMELKNFGLELSSRR